MRFLRMTDLDLSGKRVMVREDFNVPIHNGEIIDDQRIRVALPTLNHVIDQGAALLIMSHRGRPAEGIVDPDATLEPVAERLSKLLGRTVPLIRNYLDVDLDLKPGDVVMLESVRLNIGEKANDEALARRYAELCDVFVMDAFATAHRAQASTHGIAKFVEHACAGPLLVEELEVLAKALDNPHRPVAAIVGGAKVSGKLDALVRLSQKVDLLIPGGGIANTFMAATGYPIGNSLYEPELVETAAKLMADAAQGGCEIPLPVDAVVAKDCDPSAKSGVKEVGEVSADDMILDIGPKTADHYAHKLWSVGTILWNGPVGVFEIDQFGEGTRRIAQAVATSPAFSIAGGGETVAAVHKYQVANGISYICTGGGAFLQLLEGRPLPAVEILEQRFAAA